jgi:exosortase
MQTENSKSSTPISQSQWLLLALLFAGFILVYFPVWKSLVLAWYNSDDYSHGFFIVPICIFIIWQKREILTETQIRPSSWGLLVIIFGLLMYLLGHLGEIATVASFSMVLVLAGMVIYFFGVQMFKVLIFPLFLLLFMIPVPAQIYATLTIPLQLFVSMVSAGVARILGIPIFREGNVINLPEYTLQVVEACSGLRSMISLLTLSAVFAYMALRSNKLRTILFLTGIPAAIIVNIFRVLLMILAFYYFQYDLAQGSVHTIFGVAIFILALIIIAGMKGLLSFWDLSANQK